MLNGMVEVQNPEPIFAAIIIPKPSSQASLGPLRHQTRAIKGHPNQHLLKISERAGQDQKHPDREATISLLPPRLA